MENEFELELTGMAHGGSALGRHDKQTIFVPYTIPGETVLAHITQDKGRIAFAEGVTLLEASADRVFPRCPHFGPGKCGRCHWQHIDYMAQLLLKQDVLADQLERIGGFVDADVRPVIASAVGGVLDQIADGTSGLLLRDPRDLVAFGRLVRQVLTDKDQAERLGQQARQRVQRHFLVNRHFSQYVRLIEQHERSTGGGALPDKP